MISTLPLTAIEESPQNPRKRFAGISELAADLKDRGVLQPVLVRPHPKANGADRYELIFGARRLRAAREAELDAIPANVVEMDDAKALETMVIENQQREDVHPLEEADGYQRLVDQHRYTAEGIAALVGKSRAYVYGRMKLSALADAPRKAFLAGELNASIALLVARIPDPKLQAQATKEVTQGRWKGDDPMTVLEAREHIQDKYMRRLGDAGWKITDETLLPEAGPCNICPKRTGNQRELFPDVKSTDVCTDPPCFERKRAALWKRTSAEAKAKGLTVLSEKETRDVFPYSHSDVSYNCGYLDVDKAHPEDAKRRSLRALLKEQDAPIAIARAPDGRTRHLVRKADATKALRTAGHRFAQAPARTKHKRTASEAKQQREEAIARETVQRIRAALVGRAEAHDFTAGELRALAHAASAEIWHETRKAVTTRRGIEKPAKRGDRDVLGPYIDGLADASALRGLLVELLFASHGLSRDYSSRAALRAAAKSFRVDAGKIRQQARSDVDHYLKAVEAKRAKKKPARKKAKARRKRATA